MLLLVLKKGIFREYKRPQRNGKLLLKYFPSIPKLHIDSSNEGFFSTVTEIQGNTSQSP